MRLNLKVFRVGKNLTQDEIAEKIGCKRSTYSAVEKGARSGKQTFWQALQTAFEIPDSELWRLSKNEDVKKCKNGE